LLGLDLISNLKNQREMLTKQRKDDIIGLEEINYKAVMFKDQEQPPTKNIFNLPN
jgi:hypothetical protein